MSELTPQAIIYADRRLTPDQLDAKYNPEGCGEHPLYSRSDWRDAVINDETLAGYWQWVFVQIDEACCADEAMAAMTEGLDHD